MVAKGEYIEKKTYIKPGDKETVEEIENKFGKRNWSRFMRAIFSLWRKDNIFRSNVKAEYDQVK